MIYPWFQDKYFEKPYLRLYLSRSNQNTACSYHVGFTTMEDTCMYVHSVREYVQCCNGLFPTAVYTHMWDTQRRQIKSS
jgi:hypothetical protein